MFLYIFVFKLSVCDTYFKNMELNRRNTNRNRIRQEERIVRQNEERIARQQEERIERENEERVNRQNAFRNDNRDFGFRRDVREIGGNPRRIRTNDETIPLPQPQPQTQPPNISFTHQNSAFERYTDQYVAQNVGFTGDWDGFKSQAKNDIIGMLNQKRGNKVLFSVFVKMSRKDGKFNTLGDKYVRTKYPKIITEDTDVNELYEEIMEELSGEMDILQDTEGSGWILEEVEKIDIHTVGWDPLRASK